MLDFLRVNWILRWHISFKKTEEKMKILLVRVVIVAPVVLGTSWTTRKFLFGRSGVLLVFLTPEWF